MTTYMFFSLTHFTRVSILALAISSLPYLTAAAPKCKTFKIPIKVNTNTPQLPLNLEENFLSVIGGIVGSLTSLLRFPVENTFNTYGRYCEPENNITARQNTLQILAHPATYTLDWWSAGGAPGFGYDDQYDWTLYASQQGYPTFAFDRLGNGHSDHPDPIRVVQIGVQAAIVDQLVKLAKSPSNNARSPYFPRPFETIVLAGHSLGAILTNEVSSTYPTHIDAVILGGFSLEWVTVVPGFIVTAGLLPADIVDGLGRYRSLPIGYLEATNENGVAFLLFGPTPQDQDSNYISWDYRNRGTISVGEGVTGGLGIFQANNYKGKVLVITGQQDVVFCGQPPYGLMGSVGDCGEGSDSKLAKTGTLYPNAANYTWWAVPNSGHCWMHQYSAQSGFQFAFQWLEDNGF